MNDCTRDTWVVQRDNQTTSQPFSIYSKFMSTWDGVQYRDDAVAQLIRTEQEANMLAAAPDMYRALIAIKDAFINGDLKWTHKRQADSDPYHPANIKMSSALAKADGTA